MDNKEREKRLRETMKQVTSSKEEAERFLKSAGIMTRKGNLSPRYR